MDYTPVALKRLMECFAALPGIGRKTAQRLAFHVLDMPAEQAQGFARAILEAHEKKMCIRDRRGESGGDQPEKGRSGEYGDGQAGRRTSIIGWRY